MTKNIDVLETLQKSFRIVFKEPLVLGVFVLPILLTLILFSVSILLLLSGVYAAYLPTIILSMFMIALSLLVAMVSVGGVILSVEKIIRNQKIKFWKILKQSVKNSIRLSIAYSLEQLFLMLGLLLFIIPGIFLAVRLTLVIPGCILEKKGFGIKRSWNATRGNFWKIFLILVIWNGAFIIIGSLPYLFVVTIFLLPVYLTTLTLLYMQLRKR